jgi:hypothetical protein
MVDRAVVIGLLLVLAALWTAIVLLAHLGCCYERI